MQEHVRSDEEAEDRACERSRQEQAGDAGSAHQVPVQKSMRIMTRRRVGRLTSSNPAAAKTLWLST
jgi:hypothetical protein